MVHEDQNLLTRRPSSRTRMDVPFRMQPHIVAHVASAEIVLVAIPSCTARSCHKQHYGGAAAPGRASPNRENRAGGGKEWLCAATTRKVVGELEVLENATLPVMPREPA